MERGDVWVVIAYAVWEFIYFACSWAASGRTAGMALFGVRVVRDDGTGASARRAVVRTLALPLSFCCWGWGSPASAGRPAPGTARRDRRDGGHLLVGPAGGAAAVSVPGLILRQHPGTADDSHQRLVHVQRDSALPRVMSRSFELAGRAASGSGRASAAAGVRSLLAAALHGAQEHSYAGTQDREVAEHLDDEYYPGYLGFRADVAETHR